MIQKIKYTNPVKFEIVGKLSIDTETVKIADLDKVMLQSEGPTTLTETIEDSDPDKFHLFNDNSNSIIYWWLKLDLRMQLKY